jgi:glycosyltransferase involved in cell wall biosynthesis
VDGAAVEEPMKLSFIVVAANNPKSLRTCLSSLLDQTYPTEQIEIIVCDNSADLQICEENLKVCAMDPHIKYEWTARRTVVDLPHVRHKHCLYTATEIGVEMATGEWLAFPSQDDYATPVFAQRMLAVADATGAELVLCDVVLGGPGHGYFTLGTAPRSCAVDKCSFIMKRSWFEGFSGKHSNYELEDGFFVERLVASGIKVEKCAQVLMCHN